MLKVTVDIFSGCPNPTWIVDNDKSREVLDAVAANPGAVADIGAGFSGLGYRGILVEQLQDHSAPGYDMPSIFKVASGGAVDEANGADLAMRLLATAPSDKADQPSPLDEELKKYIVDRLSALPDLVTPLDAQCITLDDPLMEVVTADVSCQIEFSAFNPNFWNQDPGVLRSNNCYNYATNRKTGTFAQPGRASGRYPTPLTCDGVVGGALSDGAHRRFNCFPDTEKPRYIIAMVIWPGRDYHWYRKHSEGFWGHKPGSTPAKNTDNSQRVILDPEKCDRGAYTQFCGYLYTCKSMRVS
ncbi:hypothetical protein [Solidesulfovibrio carbinolicus]|uniref:Uncharacterized protein n=1 Tax=Solidesulfovibrio carbinolicus TaxID=296842 RepID=A0A4P6HMU7_9BACT|nr:hypothetical protein [Solidesulfovibrio carbinolicus]QAZ66438.1 hypothetical protein C3Y92_03950 [Solidesulfovibrio carbinolicus]